MVNDRKPPSKKRTNSLFARDRAERRYTSSLQRIFKMVWQSISGLLNPRKIIATLRTMAQRAIFKDECRKAAEQMATGMAVAEKASWREAAAESTLGREIYKALKEETAPSTAVGREMRTIIERNAELIKTVPEKMAHEFSELAQKRTFEGVRPETIAKEMQEKAPHLTEAQVRTIARTESSKAMSALMHARAEDLGIDWYIWRTANDGERVRKSHQFMEGVLCRHSDPPDPEKLSKQGKSRGPYPPGGTYNCRCVEIPMIGVQDIPFPCKVHDHGEIIKIGNAKAFCERFKI